MTRHRSHGSALVLVLIAVFATSILLLVTARSALNVRCASDRLQVQALTENLQASAVNWVRQNTPTDDTKLDPQRLSDRPATLTIRVPAPDTQPLSLTVASYCTYGKQRQTREQDYTFPQNP